VYDGIIRISDMWATFIATATLPIALFPAREISATAWQPDTAASYGVHRRAGEWDLMLHGEAFVQIIYEPPDGVHRTGGPQTTQTTSVNWGMLMARRRAGAGRVGVNVMLSLEPWTVPACGTLNYFQTGEMCNGDTIHDRQHPHDLFMELAGKYDHPLGSAWRWEVYGGLAGEPALGPPAFPHRLSALDNPIAPIAHHWLDSTHITFGLVTGGVESERWKLEASVFNGREPDDRRKDLDLGAFDSVSGRVSWLPTPRLALQASAGHLTEAEQQFAPYPRTSNDRVTASLLYQRPAGSSGWWASTIAYGLNGGHVFVPGPVDEFRYSSAILAETTLMLDDRHALFGRAEVVGKPQHDLHLDIDPTGVLPVTKLQAGYVRHFPMGPALGGLGTSFSISRVPEELTGRYGGRYAKGLDVFFVVRPRRHVM
jgi:hypothetical protein